MSTQTIASFAPLKQVRAGDLDVGYVDLGPPDGPAAVLLHGWPYDIHSYEQVAPKLAAQGFRVVVPYLRGYGSTRFLSDSTVRNGEPAAFARDTLALMDALSIDQAVVGGFDWGARTANIVAALWPERIRAMVAVSGYLVINREQNQQPLPPRGELGWWYQFYFATERGRAGYARYTHDFNKLIWQLASPKWGFDDATFDRTAMAFDNADHVPIVIHNYRWRLSLADGEPQFENIERAVGTRPTIGVPSITIGSDFDGAAADGAPYRDRFTGPYDHRVLEGIGHDVPQEAPDDFARAIVDADALAATGAGVASAVSGPPAPGRR